MKKYVLASALAVGFAGFAAPATFKKQFHEFTGLRTYLDTPTITANSLIIYDGIAGIITKFSTGKYLEEGGIKGRQAVKADFDAIVNSLSRGSDEEKAWNAYEKDLIARWEALSPEARDFLQKHGNAISGGVAELLLKHLLTAAPEYVELPESVKKSLKNSFPATFDTIDKTLVTLSKMV